MPAVVVQRWEESERGWGVRPDGYSIHKSEADRAAYVQEYWDSMPDEIPAEYSRPVGSPYITDMDDVPTGKGWRFYSNQYPKES